MKARNHSFAMNFTNDICMHCMKNVWEGNVEDAFYTKVKNVLKKEMYKMHCTVFKINFVVFLNSHVVVD